MQNRRVKESQNCRVAELQISAGYDLGALKICNSATLKLGAPEPIVGQPLPGSERYSAILLTPTVAVSMDAQRFCTETAQEGNQNNNLVVEKSKKCCTVATRFRKQHKMLEGSQKSKSVCGKNRKGDVLYQKNKKQIFLVRVWRWEVTKDCVFFGFLVQYTMFCLSTKRLDFLATLQPWNKHHRCCIQPYSTTH